MPHDEKRSAWRNLYERAHGRLNKIKEDNHETIRDISLMAGNFGGAALIGYMHGRRGAMPTYVGVPLDVIVWGAGGALAFAARSMLGDMGTSAAMGASLAGQTYYIASVFAGVGQRMRKDAKELLGRQYTAEELAAGKYAARPVITAGPMPVQHARGRAPQTAWY